MNSSVGDLVEVLLSEDPLERAKLVAGKLLRHLLEFTEARAAVLFLLERDELALFASHGPLPIADVTTIASVWAEQKTMLVAGLKVCDEAGRFCALPIREDGSDVLVGVLCLHYARVIDGQNVDLFRLALARALRPLRRLGSHDHEQLLELTRSSDVERQHLLLMLARNEWNIARVARLMRVTRRTIYLRLRRHGIQREHVAKNVSYRRAESTA